MNALQPTRPSLKSLPSPKPSSRVRRQHQSRLKPHRAIAFEVSAKLAINLLLSVAALSTLVKLLPYSGSQQARLQELQTELTAVEGRVTHLQTEFNRHFDPQQSMSVMQEQSNRVAPGQYQIIWTTPPDTLQTPPQ
jgi:cell division protein FtsB